MRGKEILRLVDSIHKNKAIDAEVIFQAVESALQSAAKKHFGPSDEVSIHIDRDTGEVEALVGDKQVDPETLGRIPAQTAKQIITQRIREAESEIIYREYIDLKGALVTGSVQRFEGGAIVVNLERAEGILPRSEQIPGEHYQPGERVRAIILDVRKSPEQAKIILSRTHPDFIRRLFELEVPEVAEGVVIFRKIAREPGQRTKVAMESLEAHVDCIGACVGVRGTRIKSIIDELSGEKIDIIAWREAPEILIASALRPAEIIQMTLEEGEDVQRAIVTVPEDQLALAIGRKGQNVRLAVKLTGWDIDIVPPPREEIQSAESEAEELVEEGAEAESEAEQVVQAGAEAESEAEQVVEAGAEAESEAEQLVEEGAEAESEAEQVVQAGAEAEAAAASHETEQAEGEEEADETAETPEPGADEGEEQPEAPVSQEQEGLDQQQ